MSVWVEDEGIDVTSAFKGVTVPVRELYDEIHKRGWTVTKVDVKDGQYHAEAKNPMGEKITKNGPTDQTAVAHVLMAIMRHETIRHNAKVASWGQSWDDQLADIAHAYAEAPVYDPKAAGAWKELAQDMQARAQVIGQQIHVEVTDDPHPYKDLSEMCEDVRKNRHIYVSRANAVHPLWSVDQIVAYRLVRDVLGHCVAGGDYGWFGENKATAALMPLLSPMAQKALFTESIGQAAYNHLYRAFGPQKVVFLDEQLAKTQDEENSPGHAGIHPSQSIVPGMVPDLSQPKEASAKVTDPNAGWQSGIGPLPDNAYLWIREQNGLDPVDWQGARDHANMLDTGWHKATHPDGAPDLDTQRQAVVNAMRAVLSSRRKNDRWGATHYQHALHLPATVSDPLRFWDTLETHREHHNQARGMAPGIHRAGWEGELQAFKGWLKALNPQAHDAKLDEMARRELFHMLAEEEERIAQEDIDGTMTAQEIEARAGREIGRRLKTMTKPTTSDKTDFSDQGFIYSNIMNQPDPGVYGSFLMSHIKPMAAVGAHADDLLAAARDDVANNRGAGHHWRKELLSLGLPGVGPKEASFAWYLLQPHTSQLAVLNPEMAQILGKKPEDLNDRDYFKWERELTAGRDASGYGHIPLGQFGASLWDYNRGGSGHHTDHSHFKVLNPKPHDQVDWMNRESPTEGKWHKPYWWEATKKARDQVADEWDKTVAVQHAKHEIPFHKTAYKGWGPIKSFEHWWNAEKPIGPWKVEIMADYAVGEELTKAQLEAFLSSHKDDIIDYERTRHELLEAVKTVYPGMRQSSVQRTPYFVHHETGEQLEGSPGQSLMHHIRQNLGLSTEDVWALDLEAGKR